jgi:hypothetical protein
MALALFVFLPLILFSPSKFALSFTMGSLCFMGAFAAFRGPRTFIRGLIDAERRGFTAAYLLSIGTNSGGVLFSHDTSCVACSSGSVVGACTSPYIIRVCYRTKLLFGDVRGRCSSGVPPLVRQHVFPVRPHGHDE